MNMPVLWLSEEDMVNRIAMLKRMKRLLVAEWHPVVDVFLADYESSLICVRKARGESNVDEPDVLDQDLESENGA